MGRGLEGAGRAGGRGMESLKVKQDFLSFQTEIGEKLGNLYRE